MTLFSVDKLQNFKLRYAEQILNINQKICQLATESLKEDEYSSFSYIMYEITDPFSTIFRNIYFNEDPSILFDVRIKEFISNIEKISIISILNILTNDTGIEFPDYLIDFAKFLDEWNIATM